MHDSKYRESVTQFANLKTVYVDVSGSNNHKMAYMGRFTSTGKKCKKEASHVAIPIGEELKRIIDDSRDNVASPFVVHRLPERQVKRSKEVSHPTQVAPDYLSRSFSATRDKLGLCDNLLMDERPTFHEIRALAAHLFDQQGIDPQGRMAHSDAKSTKIYTQNHIDWVVVPHGEIQTG